MSLVPCVTGCGRTVRSGLIRPSYRGPELADGKRCWRCRQTSRRADAPEPLCSDCNQTKAKHPNSDRGEVCPRFIRRRPRKTA